MWSPEDVRVEAERIRTEAMQPGQPVNYPLVDVIALLTRVSELMADSADVTRVQRLESRVAELERRNAALRELVAAVAQDGPAAYMASVVERARALLREDGGEAATVAPATASS